MASSIPAWVLNGPTEKGNQARLDPVSAVAVPLPRRPLFPSFNTSAYLINQPVLEAYLSTDGEKLVAAFMLKDDAGFNGCILSAELQGQELLNRLHDVGTLAKVTSPIEEVTKRVVLTGLHRVRMTRCITYYPLTVEVKPLEEEMYIPRALKNEVHTLLGDLLLRFADFNHIFDICIENLSFAADVGPASFPVIDKRDNQRALEELNIFKRLGITIPILRRELELENNINQDSLDPFAQLDFIENAEEMEEVAGRGRLMIAPSVHIQQIIVDTFPNGISENMLQWARQVRISEHRMGY